jgi:hypothetical protein
MPFTGPVPFHKDSMAYGDGYVETHRMRTHLLNVGDQVFYSGHKRVILEINPYTSHSGSRLYYVKMTTPEGKVTIVNKPPGYSWNVIRTSD